MLCKLALRVIVKKGKEGSDKGVTFKIVYEFAHLLSKIKFTSNEGISSLLVNSFITYIRCLMNILAIKYR